jgi:hypothetical protein
VNQYRRHLGWYVGQGLPYSNPVRAAIHRSHHAGEMADIFWRWWDGIDDAAARESVTELITA